MPQTKQKLSETTVTRKEFLVYMTMAIVGVLGLRNFLSLLRDPARHILGHRTASGDAVSGFGTRRFGQ